MTSIVAIIPARLGSLRFPGKPLALLHGRPMIEHVIRRAEMCDQLDAVYVATCDAEIRSVVEGYGVAVIMTSATHERASDRVAEAAERLENDNQLSDGIIVMIQGDEPMITPGMIDSAIGPLLSDQAANCVNLARRIVDRRDHLDRNTIKLVTDVRGDAIYFSRAPIPASAVDRDCSGGNVSGGPAVFKQVCVIAFRRSALREFADLAPTPLEQTESIDMLRLIEHGRRVRIVETEVDTHAVDTPEDLRIVETLMRDDPLMLRYGRTTDVVEEGT